MSGMLDAIPEQVAGAFDLPVLRSMQYTPSLPNLVLASVALAWLLLRLRQVLNTPLEDLIRVLGLEVPAAPTLALLDVSSTGLSAQWKPSEERNSVVKYEIRVNGQSIGEVSPQDVSISIAGLLPGRCYNLRIVAVNSANFHACSEAIRVRTLDDAEDASHTLNTASDQPQRGKPLQYGQTPAITPYRAFPEAAVAVTPPSSSRAGTGRRISPAGQFEQQAYSSDEGQAQHENPETVKALTAKLDSLRQEAQELERQEREEEEDFNSTKESFGAKKESLRQQLKERDDETKDLKKNVTSLERANTAAQSKKQAQEKLLQQKRSERERLRSEIQRWESDVESMRQEREEFALKKEELQATNDETITVLRSEQEDDFQVLRGIEEKIHERGTNVKGLEEERKSLQGALPEYGHTEAPSDDAQKQFEWQQRLQGLEAQYHALWLTCREAQENFQKRQQHLHFVSTRAGAQPSMFPPMSHDSQGFGGDQFNAYSLPEQSAALTAIPNRAALSSSSGARSGSPFYSLSLPPFPQPKDDRDIDSLTGGALTSPGADALLPSDLLGDEPEESTKLRPSNIFHRLHEGNESRPGSTIPLQGIQGYERHSTGPDILPGLGTLPGLGSSEGIHVAVPTSPDSANSLSPSLMNSPFGSKANLHNHQSSDSFIDSDRRSIKSTSSSTRAIQPPRSFHDRFFGRQRGKTTSEEGPELGTLRGSQSQSLPREFDDVSQTVPKKPATSGGLFGQMSSAVLGRRMPKTAEEGASEAATTSSRANPFSMFSSRVSPWSRSAAIPRPVSPRPASTYSTENSLPHPSTDAQPFGWSIGDNPSARGSFVANPWSNFSSRRASLAHGSTHDLLSDIPQSDEDGQELDAQKSPVQAPIGTKPAKAISIQSAQLDPTARTFKSMFTKEKKSDKAEKSEKSTPKAKKKDKKSAPDELVSLFVDDNSPPDSRKSRDTDAVPESTPTEDSTDAEERIESGPTTPSEGAAPTNSANRESFMKKLTRTSSSKFNLPGLKDKSSLFSRRSYQSEDNDEDSGESANLGRSVESVTSSPQPSSEKRTSTFSLAGLTRRGKKGTNAPSISEASMASETGDESEERERTSLSTTE